MRDTIRGEYWIEDGHVSFADGDIGDRNHEGIAIDAVCGCFAESLADLAEEFEIPVKNNFESYEGVDIEAMQKVIYQIEEILEERGDVPNPQAYILQNIGASPEEFQIILGHGDARFHQMKFHNWIAVRGNNIELCGMNPQKMQALKSGIKEIMDSEGISDGKYMEFYVYDHVTKQHTSFNIGSKYLIKTPIMNNNKGLVKFNYSKGTDLTKQINKATGIPQYRTQESMDFKDWLLKEVGTTTACIANFSRPLFSNIIKRKFPKRIKNDI